MRFGIHIQLVGKGGDIMGHMIFLIITVVIGFTLGYYGFSAVWWLLGRLIKFFVRKLK